MSKKSQKKIHDEMERIKILDSLRSFASMINSNIGSLGVFAAFWFLRKNKKKKPS